MVKGNHVDVMWLGGVYRMPIKRFRQFCEEGAQGKRPRAEHYGKCVAIVAYQVDHWQPDDYRAAMPGKDSSQ